MELENFTTGGNNYIYMENIMKIVEREANNSGGYEREIVVNKQG